MIEKEVCAVETHLGAKGRTGTWTRQPGINCQGQKRWKLIDL